jgi:hypothetical protein
LKDSFHDENITEILCNAIKEQSENVKLGVQGKIDNPTIISQETNPYNQVAPTVVDDIPDFFIPKECSFGFHAHNRSVTSMSLNPKSTILVSGGHDGEVICLKIYFQSKTLLYECYLYIGEILGF